jgi:hypothetical protein
MAAPSNELFLDPIVRNNLCLQNIIFSFLLVLGLVVCSGYSTSTESWKYKELSNRDVSVWASKQTAKSAFVT